MTYAVDSKFANFPHDPMACIVITEVYNVEGAKLGQAWKILVERMLYCISMLISVMEESKTYHSPNAEAYGEFLQALSSFTDQLQDLLGGIP